MTQPILVRFLVTALSLFPRAFRQLYGAEMAEVFAERYHDVRERRGRWGAVLLFGRTLRDIIASATLEHARRVGRGRKPAAAMNLPTHPTRYRASNDMANSLITDTKYAVRSLWKKPGFSTVAIATLALGIGANTAIFSVVNEVLLRPLPYDNSDELVRIWSHNSGEGRDRYYTSPLSFTNWSDGIEALTDIAGAWAREVTLTDDEQTAVRLHTMSTTTNWFSVLGLSPILGRTFNEDDGAWDAEFQIALLSYRLWQGRYGGDRSVIDRVVQVEGQPALIVGVMPRGTEYPENTDLWLAFLPPPTQSAQYMDVIGRVKPGISHQAAFADLQAIARGLQEEFPRQLSGWAVDVAPLQEEVVGDVRPALLILLGARRGPA